MDEDLLRHVGSLLRKRYVDAGAVARPAEALSRAQGDDAFAGRTGTALAAAVTEVLQTASGDRHLRLRFSEAPRDPAAGNEWDDRTCSRPTGPSRTTTTRGSTGPSASPATSGCW